MALKVSQVPDGTEAALDDRGPFRCDRCEYYDDTVCSKPEVADEHPELEVEGGAKVEPQWCCAHWDLKPGLTPKVARRK